MKNQQLQPQTIDSKSVQIKRQLVGRYYSSGIIYPSKPSKCSHKNNLPGNFNRIEHNSFMFDQGCAKQLLKNEQKDYLLEELYSLQNKPRKLHFQTSENINSKKQFQKVSENTQRIFPNTTKQYNSIQKLIQLLIISEKEERINKNVAQLQIKKQKMKKQPLNKSYLFYLVKEQNLQNFNKVYQDFSEDPSPLFKQYAKFKWQQRRALYYFFDKGSKCNQIKNVAIKWWFQTMTKKMNQIYPDYQKVDYKKEVDYKTALNMIINTKSDEKYPFEFELFCHVYFRYDWEIFQHYKTLKEDEIKALIKFTKLGSEEKALYGGINLFFKNHKTQLQSILSSLEKKRQQSQKKKKRQDERKKRQKQMKQVKQLLSCSSLNFKTEQQKQEKKKLLYKYLYQIYQWYDNSNALRQQSIRGNFQKIIEKNGITDQNYQFMYNRLIQKKKELNCMQKTWKIISVPFSKCYSYIFEGEQKTKKGYTKVEQSDDQKDKSQNIKRD